MNKLLLTIALLTSIVNGQITAVLSIENQQVVYPDFIFELYLRTSQSSDSIFLANSDFVLSFDIGNFNSPAFTKVGTSPGQCTFVPRISNYFNDLFTRDFYFSGTSLQILNGNQLWINVPGYTPDNTTISTRVARIDDQESVHCLGRFRVSNILNQNGFMNLQWVTSSTIVTSFDPADDSLKSSPILISTIDPPNAPLPVELSSFTAKASNDQVQLNWETKTEVNNYGFEVERASSLTSPVQEWTKIGFVEGNGNSNSPKEYSFVDKVLQSGNISYRLKQIDTDGQFEYSPEVNIMIEVPTDYSLEQNFPNPFNPSTSIKFSIPEAGMVKLTVYNLLGQEVRTLINEQRQAGSYTELFNASGLNSGVYFYEIRVNDFVHTKKMQLLK